MCKFDFDIFCLRSCLGETLFFLLGEANLCEKFFYFGAIVYFHLMSIESTFTYRQNCMLITGYTLLLK